MLSRVVRSVQPLRRWLTPAPSASWDPSRVPNKVTAGSISLVIRLPEDAVMETSAHPGQTLMEALEAADLSDVWPGGACGGACSCSTCRIIVISAPCSPAPREEEEEDMLDTAATAAFRLAAPKDAEEVLAAYLADNSRLACQWILRPEDDGLVIELPDDVCNILEVPLWLRGGR